MSLAQELVEQLARLHLPRSCLHIPCLWLALCVKSQGKAHEVTDLEGAYLCPHQEHIRHPLVIQIRTINKSIPLVGVEALDLTIQAEGVVDVVTTFVLVPQVDGLWLTPLIEQRCEENSGTDKLCFAREGISELRFAQVCISKPAFF